MSVPTALSSVCTDIIFIFIPMSHFRPLTRWLECPHLQLSDLLPLLGVLISSPLPFGFLE